MEQKSIMSKLIHAYIKLREQHDVSALRNFNVIVIIHPKTYCELRKELPPFSINENGKLECCFMELCGRKTPLLIDYELPDTVEFQIMTQDDYERLEKEKLFKRLDDMFFRGWL